MTFDVRIPDSVLLHKALTPQAKALYGLIAAVPKHDPSRRQITAALGFNSATTAKARAELEAAGLIVVTKPTRRGSDLRFIDNVRCTLTGGVTPRYIRIPAADIDTIRATTAPTTTAIIVLAEQRRRALRGEKPAKAPALAARLGISRRSAQTANRTLLCSGLLQTPSARRTPDGAGMTRSVPVFDTSGLLELGGDAFQSLSRLYLNPQIIHQRPSSSNRRLDRERSFESEGVQRCRRVA